MRTRGLPRVALALALAACGPAGNAAEPSVAAPVSAPRAIDNASTVVPQGAGMNAVAAATSGGAAPAKALGGAGTPVSSAGGGMSGSVAAAAHGGSGGATTAGNGAAGASNAGGDAVSPPAGALRSPGCSRGSGRPDGGVVTTGDRIDSFPADYDGKTAMPLLLALHAAGNPNTQLGDLTRGSGLESDFVRVFPKSTDNAWVYKTDAPKVRAALDEVLSEYCIDTSRIFATGHSSGAQMIVQMLCNGETRFKGVAPVAASKYCDMMPTVPVLYIQGMKDAQRGGQNGMDVVEVFAASNGCGPETSPTDNIAGCTSTFDKMKVEPGCVTYQDCSARTVWCSHNDNGYNNTNGRQHGWPCFASDAIAAFFTSLP